MAKVTITIEDLPDNKVEVLSNPNFDTLIKIMVSGNEISSAQGYALCALNSIRKAAEPKTKNLDVLIPRIGR